MNRRELLQGAAAFLLPAGAVASTDKRTVPSTTKLRLGRATALPHYSTWFQARREGHDENFAVFKWRGRRYVVSCFELFMSHPSPVLCARGLTDAVELRCLQLLRVAARDEHSMRFRMVEGLEGAFVMPVWLPPTVDWVPWRQEYVGRMKLGLAVLDRAAVLSDPNE